jgi:hypothetical protein
LIRTLTGANAANHATANETPFEDFLETLKNRLLNPLDPLYIWRLTQALSQPTVQASAQSMLEPDLLPPWLAAEQQMSCAPLNILLRGIRSQWSLIPLSSVPKQWQSFLGKIQHYDNQALQLQQVSQAYTQQLVQAWLSAVSHVLIAHQKDDQKTIESVWLKHNQSGFEQILKHHDFAICQLALLNAIAQIKSAQREISEQFATWLELPTATQFDQLNKAMHETRRQLHKVEDEVADLKQALKAQINND